MIVIDTWPSQIPGEAYVNFTNHRGRIHGIGIDEQGTFTISAEWGDPLDHKKFSTFKELSKFVIDHLEKKYYGPRRLRRILQLGASRRVAFKLPSGLLYWPEGKPSKASMVKATTNPEKDFIDWLA